MLLLSRDDLNLFHPHRTGVTLMFLQRFRLPILFYVITFGLAILVRLTVPMIGEASLPVTMLTPTIAAAIMLTFVAPEGSFRQAINSLGLTTPGFKGWPLAIGAPALVHAVGLFLLAALGLTVLVMPQVAGPIALWIPDIIAGLVIGTLFALCEEIGWRGYLLPHFKGLSVLNAMLIVGFLHGLWHLPILLTTDLYHASGNAWLVTPLFLITLTLAGVFYGFLRNWTGSVWPVAIAHGAANQAWNISNQASQTQSPIVLEYVGGESGIIMITGLLIINLVLIRIMGIQKTPEH
jgi:uncharacterized protein